MRTTTSFESRLALVQQALDMPSTKKPPIPSDRRPQIHQKSPKKSSQCFGLGFDAKKNGTDKELAALKLWKSMIMMLGNFIELSGESKKLTRSELRTFISQVEICLELKPGKLSLDEYANLLFKLDLIAPYKDGEFDADLKSLDVIVANYEEKITAPNKKT
jgi:hypothetical protein